MTGAADEGLDISRQAKWLICALNPSFYSGAPAISAAFCLGILALDIREYPEKEYR